MKGGKEKSQNEKGGYRGHGGCLGKQQRVDLWWGNLSGRDLILSRKRRDVLRRSKRPNGRRKKQKGHRDRRGTMLTLAMEKRDYSEGENRRMGTNFTYTWIAERRKGLWDL